MPVPVSNHARARTPLKRRPSPPSATPSRPSFEQKTKARCSISNSKQPLRPTEPRTSRTTARNHMAELAAVMDGRGAEKARPASRQQQKQQEPTKIDDGGRILWNDPRLRRVTGLDPRRMPQQGKFKVPPDELQRLRLAMSLPDFYPRGRSQGNR